MSPFVHLHTWACPLPLSNIDTDQLIPARFMRTPRSQGYGKFLLYDLRRSEDGVLKTDWPLNRPAANDAGVLVTRKNFGAGSSREAAVYALVDSGFRCIVAPSFGDIFASNAVNNGLLPAVVTEQDAELLLGALGSDASLIDVSLERQVILLADMQIFFEIKPNWKIKLLNGWDDVALTLSMKREIQAFRQQRSVEFSWLFP